MSRWIKFFGGSFELNQSPPEIETRDFYRSVYAHKVEIGTEALSPDASDLSSLKFERTRGGPVGSVHSSPESDIFYFSIYPQRDHLTFTFNNIPEELSMELAKRQCKGMIIGLYLRVRLRYLEVSGANEILSSEDVYTNMIEITENHFLVSTSENVVTVDEFTYTI